MYHFVKLENNNWYLQPHKEQDVIDHFNKVMRREFVDEFEDRYEYERYGYKEIKLQVRISTPTELNERLVA